MKKSLLFLILGLSVYLCSAQRSEAWKTQHKQGNRYEGTYIRKVNSSFIQLKSLLASSESYQFHQKQHLNIRFYSPQATRLHLHAEELLIRHFYWMEAATTQAQQGWNTFSDWPVDFMLRRLNISARGLAFLVRLGEDIDRNFAPAYVYHSADPKPAQRYVAQIALGKAIIKGEARIYRGKTKEQSIHRFPIAAKQGGTTFPLIISFDKLPAKGWYTVDINAIEQGGKGDKLNYSFAFYHHP